MTTIHSTILQDDPDMLELVNKFLDRLPDMLQTINTAFSSDNIDELQKELHKLKGIAGGFGYPCVTELAAATEQACKLGQTDSISTQLKQLTEMCANLAP